SWCSSAKPELTAPDTCRYVSSEWPSVASTWRPPSSEASTRAMVAASGSAKAVSWVVRVRPIGAARDAGSVGARQAEDVLGQIVERHLLGDRRDLVEPDLAPEALHVEFPRVPEAAEGLQRGVAGVEAGLRRQ